MADRIGQQLGNYRLVRLLGRGGFAEVYLAEHLRLKTQAAIKVLHTSLEDDDVEGFLREAQTVARLKHPHIVRVFDSDVEHHTPFLVMDYLPNGNIRRSHPKGTPLPLETIVAYVKQVASALQYAHDEKLIHRDIKPENMLLDKGETVVLSDFGIALMAQSSRYQSTQEVAGTAAYMAPEQFQGKPRRASDQYALGVTVYEWLCGQRPFNGTATEIAMQHLVEPPPSLCGKVSTVSQELEHVVMKALEKDPHKRFGSVQDFATALEQAALSPKLSLPVIPSSQMPASPSPVTPPSRLVLPPPSTLAPGIAVPQPTATNSPRPSPAWPGYVISPSQLTPRSMVVPPLYTPRPTKHGISRRAVMIGLLGLTGMSIVGGGIASLVLSQRSHVSTPPFHHTTPTPTPTATPSPTPTDPPLGSTLYTYRGHHAAVGALAWSPDGRRIASGSYYPDGIVHIWNAATGKDIYTYSGNVTSGTTSLAWSPNGKLIASSDGGRGAVHVWDATTGKDVYTYPDPNGYVGSVVWSPDGRRIASASPGTAYSTVQVWNAIDGGNVYVYRGHTYGARAVAWSPDGQRIASGGGDKTVQVWNAADGGNAFIYRGHSEMVWKVAWSPDGTRIASASFDKTVQVWNAADGGNAFTYYGHSAAVHAVAWSPDGKRIASGGEDHTVQVWDAADGGNVYTYRGHADIVGAVVWSPDGKRIASGSDDKTVQVWQAK